MKRKPKTKGNILIVLTSHGELGETRKHTGFHYEELTTPYELFKKSGYEVTLASIKGGKPPHDPQSLKENMNDNPPSVISFLADLKTQEKLENTLPIKEVQAKTFDAIYLPGGHGTMWDFPTSTELAQVVSNIYQSGKPVAAICHGIAGLLHAKDKSGQPILKGRRVNCFTNEEEKKVGHDKDVPFLLETAVKEQGAYFESSGPFEKHITQDRNLITGQNPTSAKAVADIVIAFLEAKQEQAA